MSKARDLADFVSDGSPLSDGTISVSEVSGAAPTASPNFTGDATFDTDTLAVDSTNNRVGIGTTSPSVPLEVSAGTGDAGVKVTSTTANALVTFADSTTTATTGLGAAGNEFKVIVNSNEQLRIDSSGNVGIGTPFPSSLLDVDKSQNSETNIEVSNTNTGADAQVRTKYTTDGGLFTVGKTSDAHAFGGDAYLYNVDNTNIRFATNDTERFRIGSSGELGIGGATYGTAGQVLTSGGSGAAPTWADAASGADKVNLAITETVAAGDAMQLNSDGSIDKVLATTSATTEDPNLAETTRTSQPYKVPTKKSIVFVPNDPTRFVVAYQDNDNSNYPTLVAGSIASGGGVTLGSAVVLETQATAYDSMACIIDPADNQTIIVVYYSSGGVVNRMTYATLSASGTTITASGNFTNPHTEGPSGGRIEDAELRVITGTSPTRFLLTMRGAYTTFGSDRIIGRTFTLDTTGPTWSLGTLADLSGGNSSGTGCATAINPSDPDHCILSRYNTSNNRLELVYVDISASGNLTDQGQLVISRVGGGVAIPYSGSFGVIYDSNSGHYVTVWRDQNTNNLEGAGCSLSGTTLTQIANGNTVNAAGNISHFGMKADENYNSGKFVICYPNSVNRPRTAICTYNGSTGAVGFDINDTYDASNTYTVNFFDVAVSNNGSGIYVSTYTQGTGSGSFNVGRLGVDVTTSNLDTGKMHGIAQEAGVNGDSIDVLFGGIDETQTGMTPGSKYYIQEDGTVGTSTANAKKIGRAITSTKLLVDSVQ
jgi:hypothetical protein